MIKLGKGLAKLYQVFTVADTETTRQLAESMAEFERMRQGQTGRHRRLKRGPPESGAFFFSTPALTAVGGLPFSPVYSHICSVDVAEPFDTIRFRSLWQGLSIAP